MTDELNAIPEERTILGLCLAEQAYIPLVSSLIRPDQFYLSSHQSIANSIFTTYNAGELVDMIVITRKLAEGIGLQSVGGISALASLTEGLAWRYAEDRIREYVGIIIDRWKARKIGHLGESLTSMAMDASTSAEMLSYAERQLSEIAVESSECDESKISDSADSILDQWEEERISTDRRFVPFGIENLDESVGGMCPGHQVVVGARSGVGKTRFLLTCTASVCASGGFAHLSLLEPTRGEFVRGLAQIVGGLRAGVATQPETATEDEARRFSAAMRAVKSWNLEIHDKARQSIDEIVSRGRHAIKRGARLIGVDYLQRVYVPGNETMRLKVAQASTALADMVKDTKCTSVVLSQLKRTESMGIPTMSDLRESGQIENDAHMIVLLHREYDAERGIFGKNGAYVVQKVRFGSPTNRRAYFDTFGATWENGDVSPEPHWQEGE